MIKSYTIAVPTTPTSLGTLVDLPNQCSGFLMQAPSANTGVTYFGNSGAQKGILAADKSLSFNYHRPDTMFIVGTSGDYIHLTILA